jgi:PAS domain S-box-containing protein
MMRAMPVGSLSLPAIFAALESSFGTSADAVLVVDAEGTPLFENEAARAVREVFQAARSDLLSAVGIAFAARRSTGFEWGVTGPNGIRAWYACTVSCVSEGETAAAALVVSRDITELKRSEARLRRSEQLMVDTHGVAHLGTWEWDISEPNATWSDELYRIYGLTPATYTPSYEAYLTKIHPDDRQRVIDATNRVFHEHVPYSHDERIFQPDGSIRYLHTWAYPVLNDAGALTKLVGVCQDITDRKLAEEEVTRLNENLEKRVAERTRTVEQSLRDIEAFQAMVSHDLRAPLSVISMSSALLDRERAQLSAIAAKNVERIQTSVTQMTRLVNDLLTLAHVGNSRLELVDVDLSAVCEEVVSHFRQSGAAASASIEPGLALHGDRALVRTVIENLVGNAFKYTSRVPSPSIEIGAIEQDGKTAFFVKDNGVGFDMNEAGRLFAPFERLGTAADFTGTGVGLAAVHRIVERHGGKIWAESAPGEGATFFLTFG